MRRLKNLMPELAMLMPAIVLLTIFVVVPFFMSGYLSFTNEKLIARPIATAWVGWRNYERLFTDPVFWQAVKNTFYFALLVTPFQLAISLGSALLLNSKLPLRTLFRSIALLPLLTPITVIVAIWAVLYKIPDGLFNHIYQSLLSTSQYIDWLGNVDMAMPAIVLLSAWATFPFQMLIYLAGLQEIPKDLYEAAELDGAKPFQRFLHVTLPCLRNTNIFVIIVTTIGALKLFTQVNILTHGGPNGATNTIIHYMYENGFVAQKIGYASAVSVAFFFTVTAIALLQRILMRNE